MSKNNGVDIDKSVSSMQDLLKALKKFHNVPVKRGLKNKGALDDKIIKHINEAKQKATELTILIEGLMNPVSDVKPNENGRFACKRVVANFLNKA